MNNLILLQQENIKLAKENDLLEEEVERKGNIIVKLLEVITLTGNEELVKKSLEAIKK